MKLDSKVQSNQEDLTNNSVSRGCGFGSCSHGCFTSCGIACAHHCLSACTGCQSCTGGNY
ncbi:hypothetical protein [Clostridium botulinum]|uniref:hypothetical protein n=1 Tax=Clostridium botulinum TaxID=1491 RepID=UPI0009473189|nr:hypothetical protein [Clostridium botulinum]APQ96830.1 hypothetical protein RSJ3_3431 [Clostridium botulinum]MBN3361440.1 hypothetical protein [Clostridium botulinum]